MFNVLPAADFDILLYMMQLLETGKTILVIKMNYFTISYFHSIAGYQNVFLTNLPINVLEVIKRILAYSRNKKSPVTVYSLTVVRYV